MRCRPALVLVLASVPLTAAAQPQSTLHCYGVETQIGVVARRDFLDDRGFVVKQILYRALDRTRKQTCDEDALRVYSIRTIARDALGRSVLETELSANGIVERVLRHEYVGDSTEPSRDIWSAPDGTRRYEIRRDQRGNASHLYYDEHGRVVGIMGPLPKDVDYALRWGTEVDGWSCGIGVARGTVYVHLKNGTQKETVANFVDWFESELHDARGAMVPLLPAYVERRGAKPKSPGIGRLVTAHEVGSYAYELETRYGRLPAGHYSLAVWHPHPVSGVMLLSNRYEFDVAAAR
jgi:hypothetical protein